MWWYTNITALLEQEASINVYVYFVNTGCKQSSDRVWCTNIREDH